MEIKSKNRIQFDFSKTAMERLNELKEKTESSSYAEVLKNALKIYYGLIEETEKGNEFYIKEKDGTIVKYKMFF